MAGIFLRFADLRKFSGIVIWNGETKWKRFLTNQRSELKITKKNQLPNIAPSVKS